MKPAPRRASLWLVLMLATCGLAVTGVAQSQAPDDAPSDAPGVMPTANPQAKPTAKPLVKPTAKATVRPTTKPRPTLAPRPAVTPRPPPAKRPAPTPAPSRPAVKPPSTVLPEDLPIEDEPVPVPLPPTPSDTAPLTKSGAAELAGTPSPAATPAANTTSSTPAASIPPPVTRTAPPPTPKASGRPPAAISNSDVFTAPEVDVTTHQTFNILATYRIDWMRRALVAGLMVALMCAYLGIYVVLKRIVFIGVALAEMSSAGIALALLCGFAPLLGALGFVLIGIALFSIHWSPRRVPHESYIGILYCIATALGILLIAKSAHGESHMLTLLQGDVLTVAPAETLQMLGAFAGVALIHLLFSKEFLLVSFDRESASTLGFRAAAWDFLLFFTIGVVIAFAIRSVGVLLTATMLIIPAATALLITDRLRHAWLIAPLFAALPVLIGLHLSLVQDFPASAVIVAISFLCLLPALAYYFLRKRA